MSELNGETGGIDRVDCAQLVDMAAELALGVLTGRERAAALAHLDGCPACSEYVRELTLTGEELLGLLPPHEPPAGFETRVLERLGLPVPSGDQHSRQAEARQAEARQAEARQAEAQQTEAQPAETASGGARVLHLRGRGTQSASGRRPGRRLASARTLTAAAIVGAVLAGGLGGWGLHAATAPQPASQQAGAMLRTATLLTADGDAAGEVFLHDAAPQWMYANVDLDNSRTTTVLCQLETADGRIRTVGSFRLTDGYGSWGGPWTSAAKVTGARLIMPDGTVIASATF
jgi:hypothetical protein